MTEELPDDYNPYPKSFLGRASRRFWRWMGNLTGSGAYRIIPLHRQLLDTFLSAVEPDVRAMLEKQLVQPFYMQFWHGGRISPFFFDHFLLPREIRLPCPEFEEKLYKVEMFINGRKQHANVVFYHGRIHTIEFKKPFKFYEGKYIRFGAVTVGNPEQSMTVAIDRSEHGKGGRDATG
jgi:hypothetical protein